jgi:hypothetical protein
VLLHGFFLRLQKEVNFVFVDCLIDLGVGLNDLDLPRCEECLPILDELLLLLF